MDDGSLSDVQKAVQNNIKLSRFAAQEIKNVLWRWRELIGK
jgi:hypothetical protein